MNSYIHDINDNNKKDLLLFTLFSMVLFLVEYQFLIQEENIYTTFFQIQLLVVYFTILWKSYKKFGFFSLFSLVLIGFFVFSVGGVLHFVVSGESMLKLEEIGYGSFYFSNVIIQESLLVYTVFFVVLYSSYSFFYKKKYSNPPVALKTNMYFLKIGKWLMWAFLAIEIYKGYLFFTSFSLSRVLIYLNGNTINPIPSWVRFLATFFVIGYYFIVASKPSKEDFNKYSILYFALLIPDILVGNRGMLGMFIMFYFWYKNRFYGIKISKQALAVFGVSLILFFQAVEVLRNGISLSSATFSPTSFLKGQAVSFYLVPLYIQYSSSIMYYNYPFVLYNLLSGITGWGYSGQSIEVLQHNSGIGHQLMYAINPDVYLSGFSLGTSSVSELYDLGWIGVVVGAFFLGVMLMYSEKIISTKKLGLFLSYNLVANFIISARGSYFPGAYGIIKDIIFYFFVLFIFSLIINNNEKKISNVGR